MTDASDAEIARCQTVCERFNVGPFYGLLGLFAESRRPGTARVLLPFSERLTQIYGAVHGGALLSVADIAINIAVATTFEGDERTVTVSLSMQFLAPAGTEDVEAEGRVIRRGRKLAFGECVLYAGGREIARAQATCHVSSGSP